MFIVQKIMSNSFLFCQENFNFHVKLHDIIYFIMYQIALTLAMPAQYLSLPTDIQSMYSKLK